jgi:large subunit ribosomal protein L10
MVNRRMDGRRSPGCGAIPEARSPNGRSSARPRLRRGPAPGRILKEMTLGLNRTEKAAVVEEVGAQVAKSQTLVLAEYRGITVEQMTKLRAEARARGVYLHVLKNTLARRAVNGSKFEVVADQMTGPLIYGFSEDAVAAAKVVADFAKGNDKLVLRAGAYNGRPLDKAGVAALAAIPSKEVLIAQLLGLMQSPISRLARVLAAVAEKKGEGAAAAA